MEVVCGCVAVSWRWRRLLGRAMRVCGGQLATEAIRPREPDRRQEQLLLIQALQIDWRKTVAT